MRRRDFLALLGAKMACWPPLASAQEPGKVARVGLLSPFSATDAARWHEAFRRGLSELGWSEGKTIVIEYRYADGNADLLPDLAADLVRSRVDVIVASISTDALVAKAATATIPIVVASAGDPVGSGLAETLARPGGNVTGLSQVAPELAGKRLELLREMVPKLSRVAVLWNPRNPASSSTLAFKETEAAARQLGLELHPVEARTVDELEHVFASLKTGRPDALVITPDPLFASHVRAIADAALAIRLASVFHLREFADAGGLASYGIDRADQFRRAAGYVNRILKGAKPAELPVEEPTKFELVINSKTAKTLGLTILPTLLASADEVIE